MNLEKRNYGRYFAVTPTLENLDVFTKELHQLKEIGIFGTTELPWAVSLDDLRIISETIRLPTQFTHYLKWRLYLNQSGKIVAQSELDWLGYYLVEGPKLLVVPEGYNNLALQTYTTDFDDFYLYEQGERTVPAPRPSQFCPREVSEILASLEQLDGYCYSGAGEAVLSLNFEERETLAQGVREITGVSRGMGSMEREVIGEEAVVVLRTGEKAKEDLDSLARSIAETKGKTAVVLALSSGKPWSVAAWGVCEVAR